MLRKSKFKILCFILSASWVSSSITGISYMDPLVQKPLKPLPGENPCNPLYWYPRQIPEYCYNKVEKPALPKPKPPIPQMLPPVAPVPMPPMPMPPLAIPVPIPVPMYPMPMFPSVVPQFVPPMPQIPAPNGVPAANPMMPLSIPAPYPYPPFPPQQPGLVPGIPGLVSQDGGINILPFSDAYSDMLEKHKQKMIRKRLQKVLDDYDDFPRRRKHRRRKYRRGK